MELAAETHKMTIFFVMRFCNSLLHRAIIGHENSYDMRGIFIANSCSMSVLKFMRFSESSKLNDFFEARTGV